MKKANDACAGVSISEIKETFISVAYLAWRDGVVQLCCYASTQLSSLLCSYFLGVEVNSQYSLIIQVGGAIYGFASATFDLLFRCFNLLMLVVKFRLHEKLLKKVYLYIGF